MSNHSVSKNLSAFQDKLRDWSKKEHEVYRYNLEALMEHFGNKRFLTAADDVPVMHGAVRWNI